MLNFNSQLLFMVMNNIFLSSEKKAIIQKLKENLEKGLDRNTLIFELEMEKIYHKEDLNREINFMIINGEILSEEISVNDDSKIEILKINYDN